MRFSTCIGTLAAFPCPQLTLLPKPADTVTVKCGSAWVSRGKLMKLVWEDPWFWVQVFTCLQYFLSADWRSSHPLCNIAYQHRSTRRDCTHVEGQRRGHQGGQGEHEAASKAIGVPMSQISSVMLQVAALCARCLQSEGQAFSCELEHKKQWNPLHGGFPRLENTLLINMSNFHSCSSSHLLHKAVLPLSLHLGRQQQRFQQTKNLIKFKN